MFQRFQDYSRTQRKVKRLHLSDARTIALTFIPFLVYLISCGFGRQHISKFLEGLPLKRRQITNIATHSCEFVGE